MSGSERSSVSNVEPPLSPSISSAVAGVTCISPRAPAWDSWSRNRDSA